MNRDILSWSSIKGVAIEPRVSDLKAASLPCLFPISIFSTLNLIQTCDDVYWDFVVICLVDVHQ